MRGQLRQIERRLQRVRQQLGQERLGRLPEALREYAATGRAPSDPVAAAYIRLNEAALNAMSASVGGDSEAAAEAYQRALDGWRRALRGGGHE